jgi:hypothetical protein
LSRDGFSYELTFNGDASAAAIVQHHVVVRHLGSGRLTSTTPLMPTEPITPLNEWRAAARLVLKPNEAVAWSDRVRVVVANTVMAEARIVKRDATAAAPDRTRRRAQRSELGHVDRSELAAPEGIDAHVEARWHGAQCDADVASVGGGPPRPVGSPRETDRGSRRSTAASSGCGRSRPGNGGRPEKARKHKGWADTKSGGGGVWVQDICPR